MRTIVLTGGGTAGHVLPHIALLPELRKHFDKIYYIGGNGVEQEIAQQNKLPFYQIATVKLRRKFTLKNFAIPYKLCKGIHEAKQILKQIKPDVVFSKGGFVALPVVIAAAALKIKIIAHESDMTMGLANRLTAKKCAKICTTFPLKQPQLPNVAQTGAIIRSAIFHGDAGQIALPQNGKPNLLVVGGSLGSRTINQVIWQNLDALLTDFNVLHVTGKGKGQTNLRRYSYLQTEYLANPENAYAWADIVIARAGSGTVSELLALKKPALYIPLSKAESRGDQIDNANYLKSLGVCEVIFEPEINVKNLLDKLQLLLQRKQIIETKCARQTWIYGNQKVLNYLLQN